MKASSFILLFSVFCLAHQAICIKQRSLASEAINSILNEFFAYNSYAVDVIYYNSGSEKMVDELLRIKSDKDSVQVSKGDAANLWKCQLNISTVLVFDSLRNFKEINGNIVWQVDPRVRQKHLFYIPNASVGDNEFIKKGFSIDSVSFLINENKKSIKLEFHVHAWKVSTESVCDHQQL